MRTLKFRGKRIDNDEWVYGDLVKSGKDYYIHPFANYFEVNDNLSKLVVMYKVVPETVGQFISLIDKNGKTIFEGDIIKGLFDFGLEVLSQCVFQDGAFGLLTEQHGVKRFNAFTSICNVQYEIIGNIYDQDIGEI